MVWAWIGALFIGVSLGLLGSGGSILTVPVLVYIVDLPEKVAIAESLGIVAAISLVGSIPYVIKKEVHWRSFFYFGIPGMIGTYGGAAISEFVSGHLQLTIFAVVMIMAAYMMISDKSKLNPAKKIHVPEWLLIIEGLAVGVLTGLVGVGGGFLIIPALVLVSGLPIRLAVGTSLLIITLKSSLGFYKYIDVLAKENLAIDWRLFIIFSLIGIIGSIIGGKVGEKISQKQLRKGFGFFLILMGTYILGSNLLA